MHLELAQLDQAFTAKSVDRSVNDTCSIVSTGRISGTGITGTSTGCKQLVVADHHGEAIYPTN